MSTSFADLGVPSELLATLRARGIDTPFPIQALALPDGSAGRDVCGRAPTGSGKTLAFGIPLVTRVGRAQPRKPRGLVLVPTRELAVQVCRELDWLGAPRGVRVATCYGGVGIDPQRRALRRGVDVVVACPGRLADLIERGDADLGAVELVVVDEADRMADMGFLPQVRRLLDQTPETRQTLLFSATLDHTVDTLVRRYQRNPAVHMLPVDESDKARAVHLFWQVGHDDRVQVCGDLVHEAGPTIVFCRTRRRADRVARQLAQAGLRTGAIHGDRSQSQRERTLRAFSDRGIDALVATDVAARGIHVDGIECVVHFDPPADATDYTHRAGRTARAGATGFVVSLVEPKDTAAVEKLQRALGLPRGLRRPNTGLEPSQTSEPVKPRPRVEDPGTTGVVKWFNKRKGYGFITHDGANDVFVHASSINGPQPGVVLPGQRVEFEIGAGKKGRQARNVTLV